MGKKCVLSPDSMRELDEIAAEGDTVLFIHSPSCPHCSKTLPVIKKECGKNLGKSPVNFVECSINKDHCKEVARAAKISGVPTTLALPKLQKGETILSAVAVPRRKVIGSRLPEVKGLIHETISENMGKSAHPSQDRPSGYAPRPPQYLDDSVIRLVGNVPLAPYGGGSYGSMATFQAPKPVELCVPGRECTQEQFQQRFVDFYTQDY